MYSKEVWDNLSMNQKALVGDLLKKTAQQLILPASAQQQQTQTQPVAMNQINSGLSTMKSSFDSTKLMSGLKDVGSGLKSSFGQMDKGTFGGIAAAGGIGLGLLASRKRRQRDNERS